MKTFKDFMAESTDHKTIFKHIVKNIHGELGDHLGSPSQAKQDHDKVLDLVKKHYPKIHKDVKEHLSQSLKDHKQADKHYDSNDELSAEHRSSAKDHEKFALEKIKNHIRTINESIDLDFIEESVELELYEEADEVADEFISEMAGAGMDGRDVAKHLKNHGWSLARTKGGHDVYEHPKSKANIAVPRHKGDMSAPTVLKIMKTAKAVNESTEELVESPSEHDANMHLSASGSKKKSGYYLKRGDDYVSDHHDSEDKALKTWRDLDDRKGVKIVKEEHEEASADYKTDKNGKKYPARKVIFKNGEEEEQVKESTEVLDDSGLIIELGEESLSFSQYRDLIDAHKKAGNDVKDSKYGSKSSYTVIDKDGYGRRYEHGPDGKKVTSLGKVKEVDSERGRGRPAGSKSGAR